MTKAPKANGAYSLGYRRKLPTGLVALLAILGGLLVTLSANAGAATPLPNPISSGYDIYPNFDPPLIPAGCDAQGPAILTGLGFSVNGSSFAALSSYQLHAGDTIVMRWSGFATGCSDAGISLAAKASGHPYFDPTDNQKLVSFDYCGPDGGACTRTGDFYMLTLTVPSQQDACNFQIDAIINRPLEVVGPNGSYYSDDSRSQNGKPHGPNMLIAANNGGVGNCVTPPTATAQLNCAAEGGTGVEVTINNPDDNDTAVVDVKKDSTVVDNDVNVAPLGSEKITVPFTNGETATISVVDTVGGTTIYTHQFTANCLNPAATATKSCAQGGVVVHLSNEGALQTAVFVVNVDGTSTQHSVAGDQTDDFVIPVAEGHTVHVTITRGSTTFVDDDFTMDCFVPSAKIVNTCTTPEGATITFTNTGELPVDLTVTKNGTTIDTVTVAPGDTVTKTYPMAEDETSTFRVTGPDFDTGDQSITHDCVQVAGTEQTPPTQVLAAELARTGPPSSMQGLVTLSGLLLMIGGLVMAFANRPLPPTAGAWYGRSRGR